MERRSVFLIYTLFAALLFCNMGVWFYARPLHARWANIPPVPGHARTVAFGLGDRQFSYRIIGLMLQNFGNTDEHYIPLKDYDFNRIGAWLFLADYLDPVSDFTPTLAAYYFGATQNPADLPPIIDYLEKVGKRPGLEKWRWLAQALYLARFRMHDMNRALELASELAALWQPGRPLWIKQAPVFVMTAAGDKATAYGLMLQILKDEEGKVPRAEINSTIFFICQRILDKNTASGNPLCAANRQFLK
jgi:hypothetical protein